MFLRRSYLPFLCLAAWAFSAAAPARADDQPFLTLYTTDIDTQGEREVEQWLGWKTGYVGSSYDDLVSRSEIEYGITEDLQGSLYLNYEWSHEVPHAPLAPVTTESQLGVSGELIYRVLNVYFDPVGLAFYLEPSYTSSHRGLETKVLLQKNFLNDRLRFAFNANFEDRWDHNQGQWIKTSALEFDSGLSYNVTPDFSAGVEFDNERNFDGLVLGAPARERASAYYLGPTIQYVGIPVGGVPIKVTFGAQAQLPWADSPSHVPGIVRSGLVADAERYRIALRVSRDF